MFNQARILIVEGESQVAAALADGIRILDGRPVGPAATASGALELLQTEMVDGAILDVRLADDDATPVVWWLIERAVPFVILSAFVPEAILARRADVPFFRKPAPTFLPIRGLAEEMALRSTDPA